MAIYTLILTGPAKIHSQLENIVKELTANQNNPQILQALRQARPTAPQVTDTDRQGLQAQLDGINQQIQNPARQDYFHRIHGNFQLIHQTITRRSNPTEGAFNGFFETYRKCYPAQSNQATLISSCLSRWGATRQYSTSVRASIFGNRVPKVLPLQPASEGFKPLLVQPRAVSLFKPVFETQSMLSVAQRGVSIFKRLLR